MKKPEWIFVAILLLVGAYFSFKYFTKSKQFDPLQLVPGSAVAVYETENILAVSNSLQSPAYWQDLDNMSGFKYLSSIIDVVDSLTARKQQIKRSLKNNRTLASLHVTGSESVGLMIYLPTGAASRKLFDASLHKFTGLPVKHQIRIYDKLTIHELTSGSLHLTYLFYKNYAIVSTVGYLVEDVVRNINNGFIKNFIAGNSQLLNEPKLSDDAGNLYINGEHLTTFYKTFLPALHGPIGKLASSIFMDINLASDQILLSGFLFSDKQNDFASVFKDQEAGLPTTIKLMPDNAALVMTINVSDVGGWYNHWQAKFPALQTNQSASIVGNNFIKNIQGDISLATFSSNDNTQQDKLALFKLADKEGMLNALNKEAEKIALQNDDSLYVEQYADYTIGLIDQDEYVGRLLGQPFSGFAATYFMVYNDYLVLSSSAERIKKWLNDLENDNVWGRSPDINSFIDENLGEVSFALIFNNPWNWRLSLTSFNEKYKHWWKDNEKGIKQFSMATYQFTNLDNRYYTATNILYKPIKVETGQQRLKDEWLTQLSDIIINKPTLVKNHNNGLREVLVQDSTNHLSLLSNTGDILWQDSLALPITSKIYQVDYYKNRKLQYLFATDSAIYIIDRNGDLVDGFPVQFKGFKVKDLYLLDYDHSNNYRFLIADYSGNLRMFNQQMKPLEGWSPLAFNSALSSEVFHVRVRGKDRILVGMKNGNIDLRNRRGEEQLGFPLDLQFDIDNPIHFTVGSTFSTSRFTTVSKEGKLISFDLHGKIYANTQLYQASGNSVFTLAEDPVQKDYIIARQDLNRLSILTKEGQEIFAKDYQTTTTKNIQYYSFGIDKQLYIIRDLATGKLYLYNKDGFLINSDDIYSDYDVSVIYKKTKSLCYIYTGKSQSVEVKYFPF